jgi:hypothetical protein
VVTHLQGVHHTFALGTASKVIASVGSYPYQVVRSRLQVGYFGAVSNSSNQYMQERPVNNVRKYSGVLDAVQKIWRLDAPHVVIPINSVQE